MNSQLISKLLEDYLEPAVPGRLMLRVLDSCQDTSIRALDLVPMIEANPAYSHFLRSQRSFAKKIQDWTAELPEGSGHVDLLVTKRLVGLLGKRVMRNFICAIRLYRLAGQRLPRKKGEALLADPKQLIPYALQAEEVCYDKSWAFPEVAFEAGLHYDWLAALFTKNKVPKDAQATLRDCFTDGLATARRAYRISERVKNLNHGRYVFASALVAPIGQALMAAVYKKGEGSISWATHLKDCEKFGGDMYLARQVFEKKNFEIHSDELGGLFVQAFKLFAEVEPAIRFARTPWMLEGYDDDLKKLAMILSLATNFQESTALVSIQRDWLKDHDLDEDVLKVLT